MSFRPPRVNNGPVNLHLRGSNSVGWRKSEETIPLYSVFIRSWWPRPKAEPASTTALTTSPPTRHHRPCCALGLP
ncbi:hypothetical protein ml_27 [Mollivirus sibericum]|uniref:hypothetical protein n=1 Tax=Mollivirus sibericum TaxID=1678078 RepID=UPI0006B2EED6|nr:hypothetical protein ml_27 [Mollivirus sibericum]ALD61829.1 hypothetical protein ml_27 [Mollivirus sibericum]